MVCASKFYPSTLTKGNLGYICPANAKNFGRQFSYYPYLQRTGKHRSHDPDSHVAGQSISSVDCG